MSTEFGDAYAGSYDATYETKDYEAECDLLERVFKSEALRPIQTVLDLGCGTGRHAIPLSGRGYRLTGVDRSPSMLSRLRARAAALKTEPIELIEGDIRSIKLGRRYDAVLLMFAVLGYQIEDDDVRATLRTVREHLAPGGLLIFDVWYGPAVVGEGPTDRFKLVRDGDVEIERYASGRLDLSRHLCTVDYRLVFKGAPATEATETHTVRYFFDDELRRFLGEAGLEPVRLGAFPDIDVEPSEATWNIMAVARAQGAGSA